MRWISKIYSPEGVELHKEVVGGAKFLDKSEALDLRYTALVKDDSGNEYTMPLIDCDGYLGSYSVLGARYFTSVSDILVKFISLTDGVVRVPDSTISNPTRFVNDFLFCADNVVAYTLVRTYPIDDLFIFWSTPSEKWNKTTITLLDLYCASTEIGLDLPKYDFCFTTSSGTYRVDMNEKVFNFVTKYRVLNGRV